MYLGSLLMFGLSVPADCPVDREQACVDDFRVALPFCKKAAQAKGKDVTADLNCFKYAYAT